MANGKWDMGAGRPELKSRIKVDSRVVREWQAESAECVQQRCLLVLEWLIVALSLLGLLLPPMHALPDATCSKGLMLRRHHAWQKPAMTAPIPAASSITLPPSILVTPQIAAARSVIS